MRWKVKDVGRRQRVDGQIDIEKRKYVHLSSKELHHLSIRVERGNEKQGSREGWKTGGGVGSYRI